MNIIVNKNVNSMFTWGGGVNNNIRLLNKNKDNYDIESLRS